MKQEDKMWKGGWLLMRLLHTWQYKYIESCLYGYSMLKDSMDTERSMKMAIDNTLSFFEGTSYGKIMTDFYFSYCTRTHKVKKSLYFRRVCIDLAIEESTGYAMRREIIYKVAMYCYQMQVYHER